MASGTDACGRPAAAMVPGPAREDLLLFSVTETPRQLVIDMPHGAAVVLVIRDGLCDDGLIPAPQIIPVADHCLEGTEPLLPPPKAERRSHALEGEGGDGEIGGRFHHAHQVHAPGEEASQGQGQTRPPLADLRHLPLFKIGPVIEPDFLDLPHIPQELLEDADLLRRSAGEEPVVPAPLRIPDPNKIDVRRLRWMHLVRGLEVDVQMPPPSRGAFHVVRISSSSVPREATETTSVASLRATVNSPGVYPWSLPSIR